MRRTLYLGLTLCIWQPACNPEIASSATPGDPAPAAPQPGAPAPPEGDAAAGYRFLVGGDAMGCGVPVTLYDKLFGPGAYDDLLPEAGRPGKNKDLPYYQSAFVTAAGVPVVAPNCLSCHAERLGGQVVVGLGNVTRDFTSDPARTLWPLPELLPEGPEQAEARKFAERMRAVSTYVRPRSQGVSGADNLAPILAAHRDPQTLAWYDEPIAPPPTADPVPLDVPPLWNLGLKSALYATASGRGAMGAHMASAAALCTDDAETARRQVAAFADVAAYLKTLRPPRYPYYTDAALAQRGKELYGARCAGCHGSYGEQVSYPERVSPLSEVGTDARLLQEGARNSAVYRDWFAASPYGDRAGLAAPEGYLAPPLLGIWASAPYLHNGSVPTLEALLDSSQRAQYYWRLPEYDPQAVGFKSIPLATGQDGLPSDADGAAQRRRIYDTTLPGYGNGGHRFGDDLTRAERAALIEYLKTL